MYKETVTNAQGHSFSCLGGKLDFVWFEKEAFKKKIKNQYKNENQKLDFFIFDIRPDLKFSHMLRNVLGCAEKKVHRIFSDARFRVS